MLSLEVAATDASSSLTLIREHMTELEVSHGGTICLTRAPDDGSRLAPGNPDFMRQIALAEQVMLAAQVMQEDREVLRELAH